MSAEPGAATGKRRIARLFARGDMRLVPVSLGAWSAAVSVLGAPGAAAAAAAVLAVGSVLLLAASAGMRGPRGVLALSAVVCAGGSAVCAHVAMAEPARGAAVAAVRSGRAEVSGTVTTKVESHGVELAFTMTARRIDGAGGGATVVRVPVRVVVASNAVESERLDLGSRVVVAGGAQAGDEGAAEAIVVFARTLTVERAPPHILGIMSRMRGAFVDEAADLPGAGGELLPGLSVGDTRRVSAELDAAMKASSLSHLTAVSGANCALVVGLVFGAGAALGAGRRVRIGCSLAALAGFVVLVTPEASVIRAAAMAAIAMLALLLGRADAGVAVLSLAVTVLVIADPWLARSFGFVLSVAATAALLLLAAPLARGLGRAMPAPLAVALAVPLSAQLVCGPIIVLFAPQVPLYGVPANLLAAPAAPIATVAGLAACLLTAVPFVGAACAWLAWAPSAWIAQTAFLAESLPRAGLPWWEGVVGCAALALVGTAIAVLIAVHPARGGRRSGSPSWEVRPGIGESASWSPWPPAGRTRRAMRLIAGVILATAVGVVAGHALVTSRVLGPLTAPRDWAIAACDVGQGDALLVRSHAETMMIDTGPDPEPLTACLDRLGIRSIDLLVLTHFDADHAGGVEAVAGRVGLVLHGPEDERTRRVMRALGDPPHERVQAGERGMLGRARYLVRWPADDASFPPGNDSSVVIDIGGGGVPRALFLGDLSEQSQTAMLRDDPLDGGYRVVKVAHHGSADQSFELYREASARLAVVSVGENDYGHPRREILEALTASGASIARTDESGLVLVAQRPNGLSVWRERGG